MQQNDGHVGRRANRTADLGLDQRNYPDRPTWFTKLAAEPLPLEIKMIPAFGAIEYNLSNGGWAQFLWNRIEEWRDIIKVAREGYFLIGAPEQAAALDTLWSLCERDERECYEMHERANAAFRKNGSDAWSEIFGQLTSRSYSAPGNDWEELFWDDALYKKREAWLAANEARVRTAMGLD